MSRKFFIQLNYFLITHLYEIDKYLAILFIYFHSFLCKLLSIVFMNLKKNKLQKYQIP